MYSNMDFSVLDQLAQISCNGDFILELFRHKQTNQIISVYHDDSIRYYNPEVNLMTVLEDLKFPVKDISKTEVDFFDCPSETPLRHVAHHQFMEKSLSIHTTFQMNISLH